MQDQYQQVTRMEKERKEKGAEMVSSIVFKFWKVMWQKIKIDDIYLKY